MSAPHDYRADPADAATYRAAGWWGNDTVASVVARHAATEPDALAYIADGRRYTWAEYDTDSDRIAVMMPDGPAVHAVFVGIEKAGLVAVGIGARAGDREVAHLLTLTGASVLVTTPDQQGRDAAQLVARLFTPLFLDGNSKTPIERFNGAEQPRGNETKQVP